MKRIKFDWSDSLSRPCGAPRQAAFARSAKTDEAVEVVEVESGTKKAPKEAEKAADWAETHLPSAQKHLRPKRVRHFAERVLRAPGLGRAARLVEEVEVK